jgi:hypothetical protein
MAAVPGGPFAPVIAALAGMDIATNASVQAALAPLVARIDALPTLAQTNASVQAAITPLAAQINALPRLRRSTRPLPPQLPPRLRSTMRLPLPLLQRQPRRPLLRRARATRTTATASPTLWCRARTARRRRTGRPPAWTAPQRLVSVSCNPATLARDAAVLVSAGYRCSAAGVVNMFAHTAHVESIAVFDRSAL